MTFQASGTSVVRDVDGVTTGVAITFDPNMAAQIADALNKHLTDTGARKRTDPLTGETVDQLDVDDSRMLSDVIGKGKAVRIVGPFATATMGTPDGRQVRSLAQGAILPGDVTAGQARHLIDVGLAELVTAQDVGAVDETDQPTGQATTPTGETRPTSRSSKDDWVAYAVSQRAEDVSEEDARAEAEATSKNELMAKYGSSNGS